MGIELWSDGIGTKDIITKAQAESLGGGGTAGLSRETVSLTVNPINPSAIVNGDITIAKSALVYSISISEPSWFVLYNSEANRTSDVGRLSTIDPSPASGVLLEIINLNSNLINLSPIITISNTSGTTSYPFRITNSSVNTSITIVLSYLILEN